MQGQFSSVTQSCLTLCNPIDGSPSGSTVPGILQARTLEQVAIPFSNAWKCKVKVKLLSNVRPLAPPWTAAYQAPPSMGFSRQEYWSGVPLPSPYGYAANCKLMGKDKRNDTVSNHEEEMFAATLSVALIFQSHIKHLLIVMHINLVSSFSKISDTSYFVLWKSKNIFH